MATTNLANASETIDTTNDSIVIVDNDRSIRGGRSLNVVGFLPPVIKAGHVIIKETSTGDYKPMPVTGSGAIGALGAVNGGASYTNGTYNGVALTGGSGTGATANIVVAGGVVTTVTKVASGSGYADGDLLSATAGTIGGTGSGFVVSVASVGTDAAAYGSLPSGHTYVGILISSILTSKPMAGIMVAGTVNTAVTPFSMTTILSAVKTALPFIDFRAD